MKKQYRILRRRHGVFENGRIVDKILREKVELMATAGNYAMVRFKGAVPFVVDIKSLEAADERND